MKRVTDGNNPNGTPDNVFFMKSYGAEPHNLKIPYSIAEVVRNYYDKGMKQSKICAIVGLDKSSVNKIISFKSHVTNSRTVSPEEAIQLGVTSGESVMKMFKYEKNI